jgi:S1-C subfamily serine protease
MPNALRLLRLICLACALSAPVAAAPLDEGVTAFETGNFAVALSRLRPLAEQGNAAAQFYLAIMHQNGSGVRRDLIEAHRLYRQAAEQGHAQAQFNLGLLHHNGEGVARNDAEARRLYLLAAEQGHARAQFDLAMLYFNGEGGDADLVQAHLWLTRAAAAFPSSSGADWRYKALVQRNLAASKMTPAQMAEAERLARAASITAAARPAAVPPAPAAAPTARGRSTQIPDRTSSGSGFFVSEAGHVMTNAHVVVGCTSLKVMAADLAVEAEILASDAKRDLALLKIGQPAPAVATLRPAERQGEAVAVYGFPLSSILSSAGNFTTGGVTALAGLHDDANWLQISAPVQPGNSGGPLLDESGNVVGVVVAKLNAMKFARVTADIPQNINLAIKASEAAEFLDAHGVSYGRGRLDARLSTSDIADRARAFSVRIECKRPGQVAGRY